MINRILELSLAQRSFVLLSAVALLVAGLWSALHLPIDAVPDITGVQVQINTEVPALAAEESEKLVTQPIEREMAAAIGKHASVPLIDQVGKDTLPQLLALLSRATVLLTPDSGPAHMATMVDTPVIGLYAATNPARSGPYESRRWCVNAYDEAARKFLGKPAAELPWTRKIEVPGVMELIQVPAVCSKLDELLALLK